MQTSFGQRLGFSTPINALRSRSAWDAAGRANEQIVRTAPPAAWLPRTYTEDANGVASEPKAALSCAEVGRPAEFAGFGFTWVASVDLDRPNANIEADGAAAVVGAGGAVYASSRNLYVTTPVWQNTISPGRVNVTINRVPRSETVIHAFDMTPADGAAYLASGRIPGVLLNQYSMSERNGYLRVATTVNDAGFGATSESQLRILRRDGASLNLVSSLGGLGRNERIYAVRFVDDLGYVVTFRQTDPLYVLDLRDPLAPRLAGQLSIPGYSAYLYPIGDGQLLGLGQDATTEGRIQGTQISLFDVRDPYNPARVTNLAFPGGRSEGEADPHAFLWWAPTRSVVIPLFQPANGPNQPTFLGAVMATVDAAAIMEKGRIAHFAIAPSGQLTQLAMLRPEPIRRSMIVADRLVTVSWLGVKLNSVAALQELGWMPFSH